ELPTQSKTPAHARRTSRLLSQVLRGEVKISLRLGSSLLRDVAMKNTLARTAFSLILLTYAIAFAGAFQGTAVMHGKEQCIALARFSPQSATRYLPNDSGQEQELCEGGFNDKENGLCPKTWSTSPGTVVYDISKSKYNGNPDQFEAEYCPQQRALKGKVAGVVKLASFKQSVNGQFQQRTSATYSQASPLYYHFSRYL